MADPPDDFHFQQTATLRDGRPLTIRLMRPDDRQRLLDAFARLDRQSIYTRFFSYRKQLPPGLGIDAQEIEALFSEQFRGKEKLIDSNLRALTAGREFARDPIAAIGFVLP